MVHPQSEDDDSTAAATADILQFALYIPTYTIFEAIPTLTLTHNNYLTTRKKKLSNDIVYDVANFKRYTDDDYWARGRLWIGIVGETGITKTRPTKLFVLRHEICMTANVCHLIPPTTHTHHIIILYTRGSSSSVNSQLGPHAAF